MENPCVINTQAVSASFLREPKDAPKRYGFFLRAANLECLKRDYKQTYDEHQLMVDRLKRHQTGREALQKEVDEATRRAEAAQQRLTLEREVLQAERRNAYARLAVHSVTAAAVREREAQAREASAACEEAEHVAKEALREARNDVERRNAEQRAQIDELSAKSRRTAELRREHKAAKARARQALEAVTDEAEKARRARAMEAELKQQLETQRKALDAATRRADLAMQARIDKLGAAHATVRERLQECEAALPPVESEAEAATAKCAASRRQAQESRREHADADAEAKRLRAAARSGDGSAVAIFDRDMPQLVRDVEARAGSWSSYDPVGPLGMHLACEKQHAPTFGDAIEKALGGWPTLSCFVVGCHADEVALRSLLAPYRRLRDLRILVQPQERRFTPARPQGRAGRHTAADGSPPLTVLDALQPISNDVAHNAILNLQSPEGCLLLHTFEEVTRLVFDHSSPYARAYTPEGTLHYRRGRTTASEAPLQRHRHVASMLCGGGADAAALLAQANRQQEAAVQASERARAAATAVEADARAEKAAAAKLHAARAKVDGLRRQMHGAASEVEGARDEARANAPAAALRHTHEEIESAQAEAEAAEREGARLRAEAAQAEAASDGVRVRVESAQAEEAALTREIEGGEGEGSGAGGGSGGERDDPLRARLKAVERARSAADKARATLKARHDEADKHEATLREMDQKVREEHPDGPPPSASSVASADAAKTAETEARSDLGRLKHALRKAEQRCGGSDEGVTSAQALIQSRKAAQQALAEHEQTATNCVTLEAQLSASLTERYHFWQHSVKVRALEASGDFNRCLSYKHLAGALTFEHKDEVLDAVVYTNSQDARAHASRSMKTLSGGEQAFSSLAFALSMWPFSASPLRAMDEFDKNMDQTFLQASLRLLLEASEQAPSRQMLILTPNDYHGSLTSSRCKRVYDALMADDQSAVKILHMPRVIR